MQKIFLLAGRTGGPLLPILAVAKNLEGVEPIILGIKGGFEEEVVATENYKLEYLPEVKFGFLSFKNTGFGSVWKSGLEAISSIFKLILAIVLSIRLIIKYRPALVLSAGSFLAVPVIYSTKLTNFLRITSTKIVVHQQDPLPGLANSLTIQLADVKTAVFPYTTKKFPKFKKAELIPNPLNFQAFDEAPESDWHNHNLANFFSAVSKPVFLIFGGGSGSLDINNWVLDNIPDLLDNFRVVHLTGLLQTAVLDEVESQDYLRLEAVLEDMPKLLATCNVVLCRAGMGSITELEYLGKKAFLVPLPGSHQEINAAQVKDKFIILEQKDMDKWMDKILTDFPAKFKKTESGNSEKIRAKLNKYYSKIQELLRLSS